MLKRKKRSMNVKFWSVVGLTAACLITFGTVIKGLLIYILWNTILIKWLEINLPHMSFLIAFVIAFITSILFGTKITAHSGN